MTTIYAQRPLSRAFKSFWKSFRRFVKHLSEEMDWVEVSREALAGLKGWARRRV